MRRTLFALLLALSLFTAHTACAYTPITGTLSGSVTWDASSSPYVISGTLTIPSDASLSILPGSIVKFTPNAGLAVAGILTATNTIFTSYTDDTSGGDTNTDASASQPYPGEWDAVAFLPGAHGVITQSTFRYGGHTCSSNSHCGPISNEGGEIVLDNLSASHNALKFISQDGGTTTLTHSFIEGGDCGFFVLSGVLTIQGNTFQVSSCAGYLYGSVTFNNKGSNTGIGGYQLWLLPSIPLAPGVHTFPQDGIPYVLNGDGVVPADVSLTIMPHAIVKMNRSARLFNHGTLIVDHAAITSVLDDTIGGDTNMDEVTTNPSPSDWKGLANSGILTINDSTIRYGGMLSNLLIQSDGTSTITHSDLSFANTGMSYQGGGLTFSQNSLHDLGWGVYNQTLNNIDARHNYWGSLTGPFHVATNPLGKGVEVSDNVQFAPYLHTDPTVLITDPCDGVTDCNSNILFFPGIMGSRLFEVSSECGLFNNEEERWVSMFDCEQARLILDSNGKSVNSIYTKEGEEGVIDDAYSFNLYQSFMHDLKSWKETDHLIADYALVPYDWRLSLEDILQNGASTTGKLSYGVSQGFQNSYIYKTLESLVASSRTKKVTIIAHSNGGLLTKALIQKLKDINDPLYEKIDKIIFVAVPQTGTPEAVSNILHGDQVGPMGSVMSSKRLRSIAQNMPSAYHLLPMADYFDSTGAHVATPVVTFEDGDTTQTFINTYGHSIISADNLKRFLLGVDGRSMPAYKDVANPIVLSTSLLSDAEDTRQNIGDSWSPSSGTEIYQIAGWGIPTLAGLKYRSIPHCERKDPIVIQGRVSYVCGQWGSILTFDPTEVIDGDGTVVEPSALAMSTSSENVKRYWVDLRSYGKSGLFNSNINRVHKDILEIPQLRSFIIQNIVTTSTSSLPAFLLENEPISLPGDESLIFTLHSPLTLEFTDSLGNHTGPSTSTPDTFDNGVPGARYTRYGEVQLLSIPKTATGTLTLNGISDGSFTLDVKEESGNDVLSKTSFEGIPSSTSTRVTMEIMPVESPTASSTLVVDYDGDGATDFSLIAKQDNIFTLPPLDTVSPTTTASTTGTLGTNAWYTSNVIVTLSATDTGSGVASTTYSLDNGVSWFEYVVPLSVTAEGSTTILYYSTDVAGNNEAIHTLTLNIDKTAPEAQISVSTTTQDLLVEGKDVQGNVTVTKDPTGNYSLTDQAGHTTKLFFTKTYAGKRLTYAKLMGIQYDANPKVTLPSSSFVYLWDAKTPITLLSQTIAVDSTYLIQAVYDKTKNKTAILVLKKSIPIKTQTFTDLRIPKLTTSTGVIGYSL